MLYLMLKHGGRRGRPVFFVGAVLAFACALVFSGGAARAAGDIEDRTEIFLIYKAANPVGYSYTTLNKHGDGVREPETWLVESEIFVQIKVDGQTLETRDSSSEVVDKDLRLVSMSNHSEIGDRSFGVRAERKGDDLYVTAGSENDKKSSVMEYPAGCIPLSVLPLYLARHGVGVPGERRVVKVISSSHDSIHTADASVTVAGAETIEYAGRKVFVGNVDVALDGITTRYKMDTGGVIYEAVQPTMDFTQKKIELIDLMSIESWLPWDISDSTIVAADKKIESPDSLQWLKVELKWTAPESGGGPDGAMFYAQNQQVLALDKKNGQNQARFLIAKTRKPGADKVPSRAYAPDAAYLASDERIQATNTAVIAAAAQAASGTLWPTDGAIRMAQWIHTNITPDPAAWRNDPSASTTLSTRIGMDMQAAILFAAMARSRGIPTRICIGKMYTMGLFITHYWNEVYVGGRWSPVDASTADSVDPPPLVIKLADAPTALGAAHLENVIEPTLTITINDYGYK